MKIDHYLNLYSNCIPVKGVSRSVICDLQRNEVYFIPNDLYELITNELTVHNTKEILSKYDNEDRETIGEYLDFIIENDLGFYLTKEEKERFPNLNSQWKSSSQITNAIIEVAEWHLDYMDNIINSLFKMNCLIVQIHFAKISDVIFIQQFLNIITDKTYCTLELIFPFALVDRNFLEELLWNYKAINNIIVYNADKDDKITIKELSDSIITYSTKEKSSYLYCGVVRSSYFAINLPHYTESLAHNTCLNRKIAIDAEGNIKNCPSMKESFGNIRDTTLEEAINKPGFKKYWNITKDQITKCKDCEFRHVCTDCRAYVEEPEYAGTPFPSGRAGEGLYSAPLKCGYNPYTCEWEEWSTNPLKQKAIDYYGMREMLKNEK